MIIAVGFKVNMNVLSNSASGESNREGLYYQRICYG